MRTHNTSGYLIVALQEEMRKLKIDPEFVKSISVFHCDSKENGETIPLKEYGKLVGVAITLKGEQSKRRTKGYLFHEAKHTQKIFNGGLYDIKANPNANQLAATLYGYRRMAEEDLKSIFRKILH